MAPELTTPTILVAFAGVSLICFMKGAFGGGFSIVGIPLLSIVMDGVEIVVDRGFRLPRVRLDCV
jgi:hypothetical protein